MDELVAGLQKWRRGAHKRLPLLLKDDYVAPPDDYFEFASSTSKFADHVCPCERTWYGHRKLNCVRGLCDVCRDIQDNLFESPGEDHLHESLSVKYKWLRSIQIGGRQDTEWAWMSKPYVEFMDFFLPGQLPFASLGLQAPRSRASSMSQTLQKRRSYIRTGLRGKDDYV